MATQFFRTVDGDMRARIRKDGAAVPEVFAERTRDWRPYPELDTIHDAMPIGLFEAQRRATRGRSVILGCVS